MLERKDYLRGIVVDGVTGLPIPNTYVHLGAQVGARTFRLLAVVQADGTGRFVFSGLPQIEDELRTRVKSIRIRPSVGHRFMKVLSGTTKWAPADPPTDVTLRVAQPTKDDLLGDPVSQPPNQQRSVRGWIRHVDGTAVTGATVQAFNKTVGGEQALLYQNNPSSATTDLNGVYTLLYTANQAQQNPALFVKVLVSNVEIGRSVVYFEPATHQRVDVDLVAESVRGQSVFGRLDELLPPLLTGVNINNLKVTDVALLAGRTKQPFWMVTRYICAKRLVGATGLNLESVFGLLALRAVRRPRSVFGLGLVAVTTLLGKAADKNLISRTASNNAAAFAVALASAKRTRQLDTARPRSLGALLAAGAPGLTGAQRQTFLELVDGRTTSWASFWTALETNPSFTVPQVALLRDTLRLGWLTLRHANMLTAIRQQYPSATAPDLAALDAPAWLALINLVISGSEVGHPPGILGSTSADRKARYAARLTRRFGMAFASRAVIERLRSGLGPGDLKTFLDANLDLDFERVQFDDATTSGASNPDQLKRDLRRLQRQFRLAARGNRHATMVALQARGFDSARRIATRGPADFRKDMALTVTDKEASEIYAKAVQTSAMAAALLAQFHPATSQPPLPRTGGSQPEPPPEVADAAAIVGGLNFCQCTSCRSVLSPAAYLVDLLHWLDGAGKLADLESRRPDILEVELTCENTNTVLPLIDLTLELLEDVVAGTTSNHDSTDLSTPELLAAPQYTNPAAYELLKAAVYPPSLPFDAWSETLTTFLAHLGVDRGALMRAFLPSNILIGALTDLVATSIGMTPEALALATAPTVPTYMLWGFESLNELDWFQVLQGEAGEIIDRAELTRDEFLDLFHTRWFNPNAEALTLNDSCDVRDASLPGTFGASQFERLMQFIRVWRATGWTVADLDLLLASRQVATFDFTQAATLMALKRALGLVRLSIPEIATWWSTIDTFPGREDVTPSVPSFYASVFLDSTVDTTPQAPWNAPAPYDALTSVFELTVDRTELALASHPSSPKLVDFREQLRAALKVVDTELDLVLEYVRATAAVPPSSIDDLPFSLVHLSAAYRATTVGRAFGVSLSDGLDMTELLGRVGTLLYNPASVGLPFAEAFVALRDSGLTPPEAAWLLRADPATNNRVGPTEGWIQSVLGVMRADIVATLAAGGDTASEQAATAAMTHLARALEVDLAQVEVFRWYELGSAILPGGELDFVQVLLNEDFLAGTGATPEDPWADLTETGPASANAFTLVRWLHRMSTAVKRLGVNSDELAWWVGYQLPSHQGVPPTIPPSPDLPVILLNLTELPLTESATPPVARWLSTVSFWRLRDRIPGEYPTFIDLFAPVIPNQSTAAVAEFLTGIATRAGWSAADLIYFAESVKPLLSGKYLQIPTLHQMLDARDISASAGVALETAHGWRAGSPTQALAEEVRLAARSRYSTPEAWSAVARPLQDAVRDRQRAALVSYLVATDAEATKPSDLYGRYLIDVEMTSCMLTSRIKQAIASVQLYVQRCGLGLEGETNELSADEITQWEWMKTYRVWEAARKVFLYPENWVEPELRLGKSETFTAFEARLLQGPIDDESTRSAVLSFLEDIRVFGNLDVRAVHLEHVEVDASGSEGAAEEPRYLWEAHVVARTRTLPHSYFYRRKEADGRWKPWEPIGVEVKGDHLLLTKHNDRLTMLWLLLEEDDIVEVAADGTTETTNHWTLGLELSELTADGWTAPLAGASTASTIEAAAGTNFSDPMSLQLRRSANLSALEVEVFWQLNGEKTRITMFAVDQCTGQPNPVPGSTTAATELIKPVAHGFDGEAYERAYVEVDAYTQGMWVLTVCSVTLSPGFLRPLYDSAREEALLWQTSNYNVVVQPSMQFGDFVGQAPFFVRDETRSYYVEPTQVRFESALQLGEDVPGFAMDELGADTQQPDPNDIAQAEALFGDTLLNQPDGSDNLIGGR